MRRNCEHKSIHLENVQHATLDFINET